MLLCSKLGSGCVRRSVSCMLRRTVHARSSSMASWTIVMDVLCSTKVCARNKLIHKNTQLPNRTDKGKHKSASEFALLQCACNNLGCRLIPSSHRSLSSSSWRTNLAQFCCKAFHCQTLFQEQNNASLVNVRYRHSSPPPRALFTKFPESSTEYYGLEFIQDSLPID